MKAKNTFRNLIFIFVLILMTTTVKSQGTTHTPMGQTINLENDWDTPYWLQYWEAYAAQEISNNGWDAVRIGAATSNYNCHSYAWSVVEGGPSTDAWMNQTVNGNPNLSKYWTIDAYISTTTVGDHEKIFYSTGDHSAVTTSTPGKVRSKWGTLPRYEHSIAQCPYNSGALQYYKLVNPTITSTPGALCNNSQRTFSESSFINISLNYDWSTSSPLSEFSGDGTPTYTVASASQNGAGTVGLTITTPSGASSTATKNVWVGAPQIITTGYSNLQDMGYSNYYKILPASGNYPYEGVLYASADGSEGWSFYANIPKKNILYWYAPDSYAVDVAVKTANAGGVLQYSASNTCGTANALYTFFTGSSTPPPPPLIITPNPAATQTEVSIPDMDTNTGVQAAFVTPNTYTLSIINSSGLSVYSTTTSGKNVTISTSNLKNGIYAVRVSDGSTVFQGNLVVNH
jgi:hypothetical protein